MPRNGSGIMSKPPGTTAVSGKKIEAAKFNAVVDDFVQDANDPRPISAGGTGATSAANARANLLVDPKTVLLQVSADYTAVAVDNNAVIRATAGITLSLTAAATLGSNWHVTVIADGGTVVIDPSGTETVDGAAMRSLLPGQAAMIICDGVGFRSIPYRMNDWEKIAFSTPANVSQVIQTGLSGYKALRIHGWLVPSASAPILFQVSGDNGVTWAASNYQRLFTGVALGLTAANVDTVAEASAGYLTVTGRASRIHSFDQTIRRSNLGVEKIATGICAGIDSNNSFSGYIPSTFMFTAAAVPVTALRVFASSGTITGEINFEGIKV